jgi:hypothetical protein
VIALVLTIVGVIAILSMQPLAWQGAGKADYLGRGTYILQREISKHEYDILKSSIPWDDTYCADQNGDIVDCDRSGAVFTIEVKTSTPNTIPAGSRLLHVKVGWPGKKNGIESSLVVSRNANF